LIEHGDLIIEQDKKPQASKGLEGQEKPMYVVRISHQPECLTIAELYNFSSDCVLYSWEAAQQLCLQLCKEK